MFPDNTVAHCPDDTRMMPNDQLTFPVASDYTPFTANE